MQLGRMFAAILGLAFMLQSGANAQQKIQQAEVAIVAGGCFWCVESDFDKISGVLSTTSGYIGGKTANPSYNQVSGGGTGHAEAVKIVYDPTKISYDRILHIFFRTTDPITAGGQLCDRGNQYRNAIFYLDNKQRSAAVKAKAALDASGKLAGKVVTTIEKATKFLSRRGLSSKLPQEEHDKIQVLSLELWTRSAGEAGVGQGSL